MNKRILTLSAVLVMISVAILLVYQQQTGKAADDFKLRYSQAEALRARMMHDNRGKADLEKLNFQLNRQIQEELALQSSRVDFTRISFISLAVLLLLAWLMVARMTQRLQQNLSDANLSLQQKVKEIDELNHCLELKVQQRTQTLSNALNKLQALHENWKNTQSQLLASEKFSAIGQLAAGVAHEINNPIGFINTNLQILEQYVLHYTQLLGILVKLEEALKDKDYQKVSLIVASWQKICQETNFAFIGGDIGNLIKESRHGIEKIKKIVSDLKSLTSPDKGGITSVSIEGVMESVLNVIWNELKYKAQINKEYAQAPCVVCNPQKIAQVLINLLMNAVQSIEDKGIINIRVYAKEDYTCVDVSDTGCGIAPQNITRVFDPFFSTKPVGKGVGLGLSTSYDIVRKHGGKIVLQSQLGKGSVFTVMLPSVQVASYDSALL